MSRRSRRRTPSMQVAEMAVSIARDAHDEAAGDELVRHAFGVGLITRAEASKLEEMVRERIRSRGKAVGE